MKKIKKISGIYWAIVVLVLLAACKKELTFYGISDEMKEYFVFQKGSYWIYKDDSTGVIDSTYIKSIYSSGDDRVFPGISREMINLYFRSKFLSDFELGYLLCPGPNSLLITSKLYDPNDTNNREAGGPLAFYPDWPPNTLITSKECFSDGIFLYRIIPIDTMRLSII